jgi:hypothetical protein
MEYVLVVKRLRMMQVVNAIDGGGGPGRIELRNAERVILATLLLTRPSFYLVGADLHLQSPTTSFVSITGIASIGTISDGSGNLVIDELTVGVDPTLDEVNDFEICLDTVQLEEGKQVTINSAVIEHG